MSSYERELYNISVKLKKAHVIRNPDCSIHNIKEMKKIGTFKRFVEGYSDWDSPIYRLKRTYYVMINDLKDYYQAERYEMLLDDELAGLNENGPVVYFNI